MTVWRVQVRAALLVLGDEADAIRARDLAKQQLLDCFPDAVEAGTLTIDEALYQLSLEPVLPIPPTGRPI